MKIMCLRVKYKKKIWGKKFFFCILKVTEDRSRIRIRWLEVRSVLKCHGCAPNLIFILANMLFPTQDCVHQQAGQAGGGRLYDGDINDATAGDSAASPPDPAGPGSLVVHPQSENCIPDPTFFRSGSYLQIHSESA